jgi:hypothetical protein
MVVQAINIGKNHVLLLCHFGQARRELTGSFCTLFVRFPHLWAHTWAQTCSTASLRRATSSAQTFELGKENVMMHENMCTYHLGSGWAAAMSSAILVRSFFTFGAGAYQTIRSCTRVDFNRTSTGLPLKPREIVHNVCFVSSVAAKLHTLSVATVRCKSRPTQITRMMYRFWWNYSCFEQPWLSL